MMTVVPGDIVRCTAKMTLDNAGDVQNVYYIKNTGVASAVDNAVASTMASHLNSAYDKINGDQTPELTYTTIEFFNVTQGVPMLEVNWPGVASGTSIGELLPHQVSPLVTFPTGLAKSLGKKFLGGYSKSASDVGGVLTAGAIANLVLFAADILTSISVAGIPFEIGHIRGDPAVFIEWAAALVETYFATQRRRKPGVGS